MPAEAPEVPAEVPPAPKAKARRVRLEVPSEVPKSPKRRKRVPAPAQITNKYLHLRQQPVAPPRTEDPYRIMMQAAEQAAARRHSEMMAPLLAQYGARIR